MFHPVNCKDCLKSDASLYNWDWIDHVYCISLQDREDRVTLVTQEFHKVGLCKKLIFYRPVKDTSNVKRPGTRGCWESHRTIAKKALDEGADKLLIFEDDVEFDMEHCTLENVQKVADSVQKFGSELSILLLGHWPVVCLPSLKSTKLVRTVSMCTHAYIMGKSVMEWLRDHAFDDMKYNAPHKDGRGIDIALMLKHKMYAFFPMLTYQKATATSNQRAGGKLINRIVNWSHEDPKHMKNSQYVSLTYTLLAIGIILMSATIPIIFMCKKYAKNSNIKQK